MSANKTIKYEGDETKRCRYCKKELPLSAFHKSGITKDGRQAYCRECMYTYQRIRYRRIVNVGGGPLDKIREKRRRYYLNKKKAKQDENKV